MGEGRTATVRLAFVIVWLGAAAPSAHAARAAYGFGYISEYSSNVERTPIDPKHDWINAAIGGLAYEENTADLAARVTGQVEYRNYAENTFSDDVLGTLDASSVWTLSPRRLTWTVEDAFRMVTLDPRAAATPRNLAGANIFNTGPDAYFRFGPLHTLSLGARYGNVYVGDADIDNNRYTGIVRWLYQSSPSAVWSLNLEHLNVAFDNDVLNENFRRDDAYARLLVRQARSELTLDAGRTRIDRDRSPELEGSLSRVGWRRQLSSESSFGLSAASGYQDVGAELLGFLTGPTAPVASPVPPVGTDVVTSDLYYSRQADVFYTRQGARFGGIVRAIARELDFETSLQDRDEAGGSLELGYVHSATTTATVFGDYLKIDYAQIARKDEDIHYGLRLAYLVARNVSVGLEGRRIERTSTDAASEFVDKRALLTVLYSTAPLYTPLSRR